MEEIFLPAMGMAMESATLVEWHKREGEEVAAGEEVAVVESDKSAVGLNAPIGGRLGRHLYEIGDEVPAGATVARVLTGAETEPSDGEAALAAVAPPTAAQVAAAEETPAPTPPPGRSPHRLSPRERAGRHQVATAAAAPADPAPISPAPAMRLEHGAPATVSPDRVARRRAAIAENVTRSWREVPHFEVSRELDVDGLPTAVTRLRRQEPDVTLTDFLLAAVVRALRQQGRTPDVGLAVATKAGVAVTVLRSLEPTPAEITPVRRPAVEQARALRAERDPGPAPFLTLSNLGALGVSWFTGIIPIGQQALLTTGSVLERPVVRSGQVVAGATMNAVLTSDHRLLDGIDAAHMLRAFDRELRDVLAEVNE